MRSTSLFTGAWKMRSILFPCDMTPEDALRLDKLLDHLHQAGIDAVPVCDDRGAYTDQLLLFFEGGEKFVISVDPRSPTVWLKGVHETSR
jgi:hypothetical protein